jgi:hypothetical protein
VLRARAGESESDHQLYKTASPHPAFTEAVKADRAYTASFRVT